MAAGTPGFRYQLSICDILGKCLSRKQPACEKNQNERPRVAHPVRAVPCPTENYFWNGHVGGPKLLSSGTQLSRNSFSGI